MDLKFKRKKSHVTRHGFLARMATAGGRKVIKSHRAKGRERLAV